MHYHTTRFFRSKKDLVDAIQQGQIIGVVCPVQSGNLPPVDGLVQVAGPKGQPHTWEAKVILKGGRIVKVQ